MTENFSPVTPENQAGHEEYQSESEAPAGTFRGETEQPDDRGDRSGGPESYNLTFSPDWEVDQELLSDYQRVAGEVGLNQEQAQRLADLYAERLQGGAEKLHAELLEDLGRQGEKWEAEIRSSPDFRQDTEFSKRAIDRFGKAEFKQFLKESGLGSHPAMFRFTAAIGKVIGEPGFKGGSVRVPVDPARVMYPNQN